LIIGLLQLLSLVPLHPVYYSFYPWFLYIQTAKRNFILTADY